ncbi:MULTISPECIES: TIGR01458 family HAD-type hydrolase [unclassified Methylophilus]|jgi:HAD superfamily hydrolase (TIGR01458 family)|uniref:Haloacid dehalogenase-like hydrolase domain-containing protein 2 n=1 Tax=Methylophilus glucosoxydans TaxID=752553 RepID=A0ABW3GE09_9PROT|nr:MULTISPECIES: TIGR01458 family HAD-type hydrolase [unclassified Methylophilus]MBF5040519.1 TIGR01458 family HAD-type hydrolase [Methylophilus sp. 13]MDF0379086.1 TIGR01458 family HAD-type hydrolase [Methylophilus sp. YYY-1]MDT7848649.1 TIGR01458 family HAD-type hydrolase [Methylophilus sp. VKM B-3414]BEV09453.1 TIGR01458 family HAD-type hydrolase [Methylophilus sp. DW102]
MQPIPNIKAVLFDLDGVLYIGNQVINGAIAAVKQLREAGIAVRFVTNTSTLSLASLQSKLNALGFNVVPEEIMSAPQATIQYLKKQPNPVCKLLLADDVKKDFACFDQSETAANYVVIGDIGDRWSYQLLNEVFTCLVNGAQLIAIHKNRFWQTETGLQMDIGAFVTGLEYASNTKAMLMGKPSQHFFHMAIDALRLKPSEVLMIGDDIDADIGGAQDAGLHGILVKTGKYRETYTRLSAVEPDAMIASVADLPALLGCFSASAHSS